MLNYPIPSTLKYRETYKGRDPLTGTNRDTFCWSTSNTRPITSCSALYHSFQLLRGDLGLSAKECSNSHLLNSSLSRDGRMRESTSTSIDLLRGTYDMGLLKLAKIRHTAYPFFKTNLLQSTVRRGCCCALWWLSRLH